jgi:hypothetical protein
MYMSFCIVYRILPSFAFYPIVVQKMWRFAAAFATNDSISIVLLFNGIDACIGHTCNTARLTRYCNNMRLKVQLLFSLPPRPFLLLAPTHVLTYRDSRLTYREATNRAMTSQSVGAVRQNLKVVRNIRRLRHIHVKIRISPNF